MKVLILSREGDSLGGVVNFINILKSNFNEKINVTDFTIGSRKHNEKTIKKILQPLIDGLHLLLHVTSNRYNVIHLNPSLNRRSVLRDGFYLMILKLFHADNIIVYFHGWDEMYWKSIQRNAIYSYIFRKLFSCRRILVLASDFRRQLIEIGFKPENIEVTTTMFSGDSFSRVSKSRIDDTFQVLFLSRLIVEKGPYELLEAFIELISRRDKLRLVLAGDGSEFDKLKALVEKKGLMDKVCLPGYIRNGEKANVMVNSDLFILPTYHGEGCPVSLLEAMAAGLPVISSRVGAIPEIVKNNQNGVLLDTVSKEEIAKSVSYCLDNPDFLSRCGKNNRIKAWEKYEASIVTKKMENLYSQIAHV